MNIEKIPKKDFGIIFPIAWTRVPYDFTAQRKSYPGLKKSLQRASFVIGLRSHHILLTKVPVISAGPDI